MKLLNEYKSLEQQILDYFGYVEDWHAYPIEDSTEYYWCLPEGETGYEVRFAKEEGNVFEGTEEDGYSQEILHDRFLSKYVYRGEDFTMVIVDTRSDGNQFLMIFTNSKEIQAPEDYPY